MNQFKCARSCLAAGYFMSLGTPTLSRRYASDAAVSFPASEPFSSPSDETRPILTPVGAALCAEKLGAHPSKRRVHRGNVRLVRYRGRVGQRRGDASGAHGAAPASGEPNHRVAIADDRVAASNRSTPRLLRRGPTTARRSSCPSGASAAASTSRRNSHRY